MNVMQKSVEIRGGIAVHVFPSQRFDRPNPEEDRVRQAERDREIVATLLDIARTKAAMPTFTGLDAHETLVKERGATLPVKALLEIRKSVGRIIAALPVTRTVERRNFACPMETRAAANSTDRRMTLRASTPSLDAHNTIVNPMGIKTERFSKNPAFLWSHAWATGFLGGTPSMDDAIGKGISWSASPQSFDIDVEFDVSPRGEEALRKCRAGILNACSIGFQPLKWHEESRDGNDVVIFDEIELLEVSLCMIGSNKDSLVKRSEQPLRAAHEY